MTVRVYTGGATVEVVDEASPPPPDPSSSSLAWFTSKASRSITNIGTNTLQAMNPWPTITPNAPSGANGDSVMGFAGILAASGMVFLPWYGKAGAIVVFGGGHNDYCGNDMYLIDLYTQVWTQLKPPRWPLFKDAAGYHASVEGEQYADVTATTTLQDQPSTGHNYGVPEALPPDANFPQGAILMGCISAMPVPGQRGGQRAHVFDLATKKWSRYSTNLIPSGFEFAGAFIDKTRNRYVMPLLGNLGYLDLATRTWTKAAANAFAPSGVPYMMWQHYQAADLYVGLERYSVTRLWCFDPVTNVFTRVIDPSSKPGVAQAWPVNVAGGGACWSELLGGFAWYGGQGERTVVVVKPPSGDPSSMPWDISSIDFTGDAPAKDTMVGAGSHCKRFLEHKAAGGFLWLGNTSQPMQFFKL